MRVSIQAIGTIIIGITLSILVFVFQEDNTGRHIAMFLSGLFLGCGIIMAFVDTMLRD